MCITAASCPRTKLSRLSSCPRGCGAGLTSGTDRKQNGRKQEARQVPKQLPRSELPLLGSNQDSPDPEGAVELPEFQQLAALHASSCHPMLEFAEFDARLCRTLLAQMLEFAVAWNPGGQFR
jgi:hypothetical protein